MLKTTSAVFLPTPEQFAALTEEEIGEEIRSCGLYKSKSKKIKESSRMICENFGGEVPQTLKVCLFSTQSSLSVVISPIFVNYYSSHNHPLLDMYHIQVFLLCTSFFRGK